MLVLVCRVRKSMCQYVESEEERRSNNFGQSQSKKHDDNRMDTSTHKYEYEPQIDWTNVYNNTNSYVPNA